MRIPKVLEDFWKEFGCFGRRTTANFIVLEDFWKDFEEFEVLLAGTSLRIPIVLEDFWKEFGCCGWRTNVDPHSPRGFFEGF